MADIALTDQNFEQEVLQSRIPVLVDFWAEWCIPCRMVSPIVDELAGEYEGRLKVLKINVDENQQTAAKYGIMSIPSLLIFQNGSPAKTIIGPQGKDNIKKEIEKILSS